MNCKQSALHRSVVTMLSTAALFFFPIVATAQAWPSKIVRIVVGAPPGGTSDILARLLAEGMQKEWGQPVIVEAKPGAAGSIGVNDLIHSRADGYTLYLGANATATEIPLVVKVRYDPFKDLKPLVDVSTGGLILVGNPLLPANNLADLIKYIKANPGKISYASYSTGTISHTMGLELNKAAGIDMTHVPYKGSPPALQDVMGGHVSLMLDGPVTSLPLIKAGKLKAFAVSGPKRNPALPDVPTFAEQGFPAIDGTASMLLWVRPGVPAEVQAKIRSTAMKVISQPSYKTKLLEIGSDQGSGATPDVLTRGLHSAYEKQETVLKALGIKPQDLGG